MSEPLVDSRFAQYPLESRLPLFIIESFDTIPCGFGMDWVEIEEKCIYKKFPVEI